MDEPFDALTFVAQLKNNNNMTQHFKILMRTAFMEGYKYRNAEELYVMPEITDETAMCTTPETHVISIYRNSFDDCTNPMFALSVFESMSNGTGHINSHLEIGWEFPIEISEEYVKSVLIKWGCKF